MGKLTVKSALISSTSGKVLMPRLLLGAGRGKGDQYRLLAVPAPLLEVSDPAARQVKRVVWGSWSLPGQHQPDADEEQSGTHEMSGQGCRQWWWPMAGATSLVLSMGHDSLQRGEHLQFGYCLSSPIPVGLVALMAKNLILSGLTVAINVFLSLPSFVAV